MEKNTIVKTIKLLLVLLLVLRFAFLLVNDMVPKALAVPLGSFDFQWGSAKVLAMGMNPYEETLYHIHKESAQFEEYYGNLAANQFPSVLCLLLPWTLFGVLQAKTAWLISQGVFAILLWISNNLTVFKEYDTIEKTIWNLLWLCSTPLLTTIGNGQHLLFAFSFFMFSLALSEKAEQSSHRKIYILFAGLALAVSYFKYTLTFVTVLYFIRRKWFPQIGISAITHCALTGIVSIYLRSNPITLIMESLEISAGTGLDGSYDLMSFFGNGIMYKAIMVVLAVFGISIVLLGRIKMPYQMLMLLIIFSMIIVYHRGYDYFILTLPMSWFLHYGIRLWKLEKKEILSLLLVVFFIVGYWFILFYDTIINNFGIRFSEHPLLYNLLTVSCIYGSLVFFVVNSFPITRIKVTRV